MTSYCLNKGAKREIIKNLSENQGESGVTMITSNVRYRKEKLNDQVNVLLNFSRGAKTRKRIIKSLMHTPKNCNQIAQELKADWWTIQKHLQRLEKAGIIKVVYVGRMRYYTLKGNALDTDGCPSI